MRQISERDLVQYEELYKFGVFQDVKEHFLNDKIILICCSDGHQFIDLFLQQMIFCAKKFDLKGIVENIKFLKEHLLIHPLALNGGALLLPLGSPLNKELGEDRILLAHLKKALEMKKDAESIVLYTHAPCGVAEMHDLDLFSVSELFFQAKMRIRIEITHREIPIACLFHMDSGNGSKKTRFASKALWKKWLELPKNEERLARWNAYEKTLQVNADRQRYLDR